MLTNLWMQLADYRSYPKGERVGEPYCERHVPTLRTYLSACIVDWLLLFKIGSSPVENGKAAEVQ